MKYNKKRTVEAEAEAVVTPEVTAPVEEQMPLKFAAPEPAPAPEPEAPKLSKKTIAEMERGKRTLQRINEYKK